MNARATIVIPLLRQRDRWLDEAVRSAVLQTAACEVIVVTSRETPLSNRDLLRDLALRYRNLRVLFRDLPRAFPGALNFGIRAASTNRVGLLFSDDWLEPDCVAECLAHDSDIVSTGRSTYYADGLTPVEGALRASRMEAFLKRPTPESKASYLTHFFLFRREALARAGYVDESIGDFPGIDDHHLIWTMLELGASVSIVEKCLYNCRDHPGERLTTADPVEAVRNLGKILRKHRVEEPEFSRLIAAHGRWYGKPMYEALGESEKAI